MMKRKDEKATQENDSKKIVFETLAKEWIQMIRPQIKESSVNKYQNLLETYIYPAFGDALLERITQEFLEIECNKLLTSGGKKGNGLSSKTVEDIFSVVKNVLHFATRRGYIFSDNVYAVRIKHVEKKMRVLSRKEQEILCRYLCKNLTAPNTGILLCLFTGIRVGELCALRWEDISFAEKTIYIHQTMQRIQDKTSETARTHVIITSPKSACSIRFIPIPEELFYILCSCESQKTGFFLTSSETQYIEPRTMQNYFKKAIKECVIAPANFHALRHTFATRCVEVGFDVKSLSEILGHSTVNITMNRYVHPSMELKKENMQRLSELFIGR